MRLANASAVKWPCLHDAMNEKHPGISFASFDAADFLDDEETIAEYLTAASENPNPEVLRAAEQDVARARARRREEIAADARASIAAFRAGELKAYSAEELIAELHQSLEDQVEPSSDAGIPNAVTQRTFAETDVGGNIVRCEDAQDMFARLWAQGGNLIDITSGWAIIGAEDISWQAQRFSPCCHARDEQ